MLQTFCQKLINRRWAALLALLAVTVSLGGFGLRVGFDNKIQSWFVEGDPTRVSYEAFQQTFGNDEVVAVAIVDSDGIWRAETLNALRALTATLEGLEGVASVLGIANAQQVALKDEALDVSNTMTSDVDAAGAEALKAAIDGDSLLKDRFVVADGTVALLYVQMEAGERIDEERPLIIDRIDRALDDSGLTHHTAGVGIIINALNKASQTEGILFMAAAFLVIFLGLWPLFRSVAAVLASIAAVSCALTMTRGLYGLLDRDENMVTMTLPVIVLVLGVADCIHIFRYRASRPDDPPARVLADILTPCLFTTLTTMVGFAALATSRMAVVRDLGIFASLGIGLAFVSSTVLAAFVMGREGFTVKRPSAPGSGLMGRFLKWTADYACANKEAVLGATALLIMLAAFGVSRVSVDTYSLGFLASSHPVRADSEAMERAAGPFTPLELLVRGDTTEALVDPAVLRPIMAFQDALEKDPQVHDTFSVANVVARLHQVQSGEEFEVPDDEFMVADNVEIFKSDPDGRADTLVDDGWKTARITASVPVLSAAGYRDLIARAEALAKDTLPDTVTVEPSGYLPLYVKMMDYVVESQVSSFGAAFVVVFLLIGLLFRSLKITALAVLPNVLPVFVTLGVMGMLEINLDVATVTITSIIMGIVVDDTIHYLHRFREELKAHDGDFLAASRGAAIKCGRAIGATTVIFTAGFLVLGLASVKSVVYFGLLTSLAMVVALIGDLLILPAVLVALEPRL